MNIQTSGGFLILRDRQSGRVFSIDYRDTAYSPAQYQTLVFRATSEPVRYISQVVADMWIEAYANSERGVMMFRDWL